MKKAKIMLLSLALFAVVGAALAFKAKFDNDWCIGTPYQSGSNFYCTHDALGPVTTTDCTNLALNITTFVQDEGQEVTTLVCTTIPDPIDGCNRKLCPVKQTIEDDGGQ